MIVYPLPAQSREDSSRHCAASAPTLAPTRTSNPRGIFSPCLFRKPTSGGGLPEAGAARPRRGRRGEPGRHLLRGSQRAPCSSWDPGAAPVTDGETGGPPLLGAFPESEKACPGLLPAWTGPPGHFPSGGQSPFPRKTDRRHGHPEPTSDSFYAKSRIPPEDDLLSRARSMVAAGAAVLDLGAESTRPGSEPGAGSGGKRDGFSPPSRPSGRPFRRR